MKEIELKIEELEERIAPVGIIVPSCLVFPPAQGGPFGGGSLGIAINDHACDPGRAENSPYIV